MADHITATTILINFILDLTSTIIPSRVLVTFFIDGFHMQRMACTKYLKRVFLFISEQEISVGIM
jgi:hypothetical protein